MAIMAIIYWVLVLVTNTRDIIYILRDVVLLQSLKMSVVCGKNYTVTFKDFAINCVVLPYLLKNHPKFLVNLPLK